MTADNASSNKVQAAALRKLNNSFEDANHIWCFNHTIQLSSKVLIKPFNVGMGKVDTSLENAGNNIPSLEEFDHIDDTDNNADSGDISEDGDEEDDGDFEKLSEEEHSCLLDNILAIRETVSKVTPKIYLHLSDIVDMFLHSFNNSHLQSFARLLSRFQLGNDCALFMNLN